MRKRELLSTAERDAFVAWRKAMLDPRSDGYAEYVAMAKAVRESAAQPAKQEEA